MTKEQLKNKYERYTNSDYYSVDDFYKKPSYYKQRAEYLIQEKMKKVNGFDYKVVSGNCMTFTAGWCYPDKENGNVIFVYETAYNTYTLEV